MVKAEVVDMIVSLEKDKIGKTCAKWMKGEEITKDDRIAYYSSLERLNIYRHGDPRTPNSKRERYVHRAMVGMGISTRLKFGLKKAYGVY